jgi:hypothetical protein
MKYTCPNCQKDFDIKEKPILDHIGRSSSFRSKVMRVVAGVGHNSMTPEERSERARLAVAAREEKRKERHE